MKSNPPDKSFKVLVYVSSTAVFNQFCSSNLTNFGYFLILEILEIMRKVSNNFFGHPSPPSFRYERRRTEKNEHAKGDNCLPRRPLTFCISFLHIQKGLLRPGSGKNK